MCGIAGVFNSERDFAATALVKRMGGSLAHRGPDNLGFAEFPKVAMTTSRLSMLDLSDAGNQPFVQNGNILSYNGEIYNYKELRDHLISEHKAEFTSNSDTEVLFHHLIHYGIEKTLSAIRGMFAFAFYSEKDAVLFLARDRLGIKPLYYLRDGNAFVWASEIKAIVEPLRILPDVTRTLLSLNSTAEKSSESTLFQGVRSVTPGTFLSINDTGQVKHSVYYDVIDQFDSYRYSDLSSQPTSNVVSTFRDLFTASVESMANSDAPVGALVSGGIDSSLIAAVSVKINPGLELFTANIKGAYSELDNVRELSTHLGKEVSVFDFEPEMMLRDWVEATYFYECPIVFHVNAIPLSNVVGLAREKGMKALLTGEGADELFLGYPSLLTKRYEKLATLPVNIIQSLYNVSPKMRRFLFQGKSDERLIFMRDLVQGFESERFKRRAAEKLSSLGKRDRREQSFTLQMIREQLVTLLHRNDRMGMMNSVEARFPFLDEDIVTFAINLPSKFKIRKSIRSHNYKHPFLIDKWIVRKSSEDYLPRGMTKKKKNGFPMLGHKFVKIRPGFFENGWVANELELSRSAMQFLIEEEDPYLVAKLASVEIFARIYACHDALEDIKNHVMAHAEICGDRVRYASRSIGKRIADAAGIMELRQG